MTILTIRQAAPRLGISVSKTYQLIAARAIGHYRIGGKIVLTESDIDAYLASCRVGVAAAAPAPLLRTRPRLKHLKLT